MKNFRFRLNNKGYAAIPLVMGLAGAGAASALGYGTVGVSVGYIIGSALGAYFFPTETEDATLETSTDIQNASVGIAVPVIYGTRRVAGNIIWLGDLNPYTPDYDKKDSKGGGSGGGKTTESASMYKRSFLIGICQGEATVLRLWAGSEEIDLTNATFFHGDGNVGLEALVGEDYTKYKDLCCAFFDEYDLGTSTAIPNFNFEVRQGMVQKGDYWNHTGNCCCAYAQDFLVFNSKLYCTTNGEGRLCEWNGVDTWVQKAPRYTQAGPPVYENYGRNLMEYNGKIYQQGRYFLLEWNGVDNWIYHTSQPAGFPRATVYGEKIYAGSPTYKQVWVVDHYEYWNLFELNAGEDGWINKAQTLWYTYNEILYSLGVNCMCVFNDTLYAGMTRLGFLLRFTGTSWEYATTTPVGDQNNKIDDLVEFNSKLYGTASGKLLEFNDDTDEWVLKAPAYSSENIISMFVWEDKLWAVSTHNYLLKWDEEGIWEKIGNAKEGGSSSTDAIVYDDKPFFASKSGNIFRWDGELPVENANPADVIKDLHTNTKYGAAVPVEHIDDDSFASVKSYCDTMGYLFSFALPSQKPLVDWVDYVCSHFKGYQIMDGAKIELGVFKDEDSAFEITQDDLVVEGDTPPVSVKKREYKDTYNRVNIEWIERDNDYEKATAVANDEVDQRLSKNIRSRKIQLNGIMTDALAGEWAYRYLVDSLYRFSFYTFTVGYKDMVLQPGDVGVLSDGYSIVDKKIRITSVNETKDGKNLSIEAVEDTPNLYGVYNYSVSENKWTPPVTPDLLSPVAKFVESIHYEHMKVVLVPQDAKATGFLVYRSFDGTTFKMIGFCGQTGTAGSLTTTLGTEKTIMYKPNDYFEVDVGAQGKLISVEEEDFLSNRSVCKVGDEFIAFQTVELIAGGVKKYRITKLIRGLYNTKPVAHAIDSIFILCQNAYKYTYEKDEVGKTIYFKFLTIYGKYHQELADVSAQSHLIVGQHYRPAPATLIRIKDRGGMEKYTPPNVTLAWNICGKISGYGLGGYGSVGYGSYVADSELENMILRLEKENGDLLEEKILAKDDEEEEVTPSENTVVVKVIPSRDIRDLRKESITISKV